MIKEWSLKNLLGHVEEDQKLFGAGQDDGLGVSDWMSFGISVRGKNPGRGCVDMRKGVHNTRECLHIFIPLSSHRVAKTPPPAVANPNP